MSLKSAKKVETNTYELEIEISGKDFMDANLKAYNKNKNRINIPGFRKGKAPRSIIEKMYGKDFFYEDAMDILFPDLIADAYEKAEIDAVDNPYDYDVKEMGEEGVLFTVRVTVKPEAKVSDYKGIEATKSATSVSDKEVDDEIERMRDRNSRTVTVEGRAAQDGDIAVIDFEGFVDEVPFDGGKGENYSLTLGSGSFIPGFEEQIVGKNAGEEFDVNVTFPEEYSPELAGKAAVFKVKLHEIKAKELPELDDEFVKDISEHDTLDELKKSIKEDMAAHKAEHVQKDFEQAVIAGFLDRVEVEIPDVMVEKRAAENIEDYEKQIKASGFDLEMYLQLTGSDMESFSLRMHEDARNQVKLGLALEKLAELEKFEVSEEEYEEEYKKIAEMYSMDLEQVKAIISNEALKPDILNKKAWDFVIANAVVLEEKAEKKAAPKAKAATAKKKTKEDKKDE